MKALWLVALLICALLVSGGMTPVTAAPKSSGVKLGKFVKKKATKRAIRKKKCMAKKGKRRQRCIVKATRCKKRYAKIVFRKRTRARCVRRPGKPKPPGTPAPSTSPIDYSQIKGLSKVQYSADQIETTSQFVPSFDDTEIYIEVIKPKEPGNYPVIMEISGYHGTLYNRTGTRILPHPQDSNGDPIGLTGYFVPRGYAVVMMDVRGTGKSGGCLDHLGQNDLGDIKHAVEWAASQPWSNGKVGVTGHSYVGGTTNLAGASGAKGLATIVPSASLASMYDHQFQAGVPYNAQYLGPIEAYEQLALQADLPPQLSPVSGATGNGGTGEDFGVHPTDTGCGIPNSAIFAGTGQVTGQYEDFHRQRDHRQAVAAADIPIFLQHGTVDEAARIGGVQWFFERGLREGDKLWIGQWDHGIGVAPTRRAMQWTYALHAWFDRHLMGKPVDTGAPLEVFLNDELDDQTAVEGQGEILAGRDLPATQPLTLHARADEGLGAAQQDEDTVSFVGDNRGFTDDNEAAGGVTFQTEPFTADHLFFGLPAAQLHVATSDPQTHVIATLFAVDEDGLRRRLTQCAMNPILKDGVDKTAPIPPQQMNVLTPPCFAMAFHVRAGQSLRLRITTSDPDKLPIHSADPNVVVGFGGENGTRLTLPEVTTTTYADNIDLGDLTGDENASG